MSTLPIWIVLAGTLLLGLLSIEAGYRLGRSVRRKSEGEKESPASAIAATILALLAFIMALTFGMVSDRYEARKAFVREEANAIRTAWARSEFLPEPDRDQAARLLKNYVDLRLAAVSSGDIAQVRAAVADSVRVQRQLWDMAVVNARKDLNSDVAALYIEALDDVSNLHASRVAIGLQAQIPAGIWLAFYALVVLSMIAVGYHAAIAGSSRSWMMPILALAFSVVVTLIAALDATQGSYLPISQRPLQDVRDAMSGRIASVNR